MRALLLFALALPVAAQTGQASRPDTSEVFTYGQSRTYRAILAETRQLQIVAPDTAVSASPDPALGIGQLVVDETVSRTGSYCYDVFYRLWRPPADARFVSVVLSEQPLPGQGTLIAVRLDGEIVFQGRLTPSEEAAEALARQAIVATLQRLPRG